MPSTKTTTILFNDVVVTSAGSWTSAATVSAGYGAALFLKITNGGTGPSTAGKFTIETGNDGTNWFTMTTGLQAGQTASTAYSWGPVKIDPAAKMVRVTLSSNTTDVTARAEITEITAI